MANSTASYAPDDIKSNAPHADQIHTMWAEIYDIYNTMKGSSSYSDVPPMKQYSAFLEQGGEHYTASPAATELFNNTGVTPVYSRSAAGHYVVTASGLFTTRSYFRHALAQGFASHSDSGSLVYAGRSGSDNYGYIHVGNLTGSLVDQYDHLLYEIITIPN